MDYTTVSHDKKVAELENELIKKETRYEFIKKQLFDEHTRNKRIFDYFNEKYPKEMAVIIDLLY